MSAATLAAIITFSATPVQIDSSAAEGYREVVGSCLDNLLKYGTDTYGEVRTPMLMSVIDVRTNESPREPELMDALIRTEGRHHRRNPGGCDLWDDQPLIRTMYTFSELTGNDKYAKAAGAYIKAYFERAPKPNGLLAWGSHIFYDAYKDGPGGDQDGAGPHEILVLCPNWDRMWDVAPELVQKEIELIWEWHVVDKETGLHNRHDDKSPGCDFAFSGGEFGYAFAFLFSKTNNPQHLKWAKTVFGRHWNTRNPATNLAPDAPGTGDRYDAHHCFTTLPGPHASLLLKSYEVTGDEWFRDTALAHIKAYLKYGWDAGARRYHAMLTLDGKPVPEQKRDDTGYDIWKPTGYVDIWRTIMFSYEFPIIAAQTAVYAYELTGDKDALESALNWAGNIRANLPPVDGRRWRKEIREALPEAEAKGGTYAENYGRAISFFLHLHYATKNDEDLATAKALAGEAIEKLQENGWIKGHPAKPYYESVDGVAYLLYALLELSECPKKLPDNL